MNVTVRGKSRHFRTVSFDAERNAVLLIEQRLLPHKFAIVATRDFRETAAAIRDMVVRGAGAIGATAAYGLAQGVCAFKGRERKKFSAHHETVYVQPQCRAHTRLSKHDGLSTLANTYPLERNYPNETWYLDIARPLEFPNTTNRSSPVSWARACRTCSTQRFQPTQRKEWAISWCGGVV